jgi:hypothetical protein
VGYKREARVYNLVFEDPEFDGLEVRVRSMSIGKVREFLLLQRAKTEDVEDALASTEKVFEMFASCLLSWNLEDDAGFSVPANREGINSQDMDFVMEIISAWMGTITGVPDETPLPETSTDGERFPVESIPMETLSPAQAS